MEGRDDLSAAPRNAAKKKGTSRRKRAIKAKAPKFKRDSRLKSDDYLYGKPYPAVYRNDALDALCGVEWKVLDHCDGKRFLEQILVSNEGFLRYVDQHTGILMEFRGGLSKIGYLQKGIKIENQKTTRAFCVHRLVWSAFNGEIPVGMDIDHINGNKEDNRLGNLRVVTHRENLRAYGNDRRTHNQSLPVKAVNLKTGRTIYFASTADAGRNGFTIGGVSDACKGIFAKRNSHGGTDIYKGYRWSYVDETDQTELALYEAYISGQLSIFD